MRSTLIGTIIANYRVLDLVSVGGMGTVYRAEHMLIGRIVAIKVLHAELSTNREIINRFFNEAKATTTIGHPGIVEIFDFGHMDSGHAYIVMEFLDGVTLSRRIKLRGPMAEQEAASYLSGVCSALAAAHDKGIVHRDLKPDNIILVPDLQSPIGERSKLLDFGIAKLTDTGFAGTATKTGAVMGTPTYMSPEQCRGTGNVDQRTDIYAIGCMFYELISGRPPFINPGMGELIGSHLFVQPDPVSKHAAHVSPTTDALIMKLLDKQPENRVQTARQLVGLLTAIAERGTHSPTYRDALPQHQVRAPDEPTLPQRPLVLPPESLPTPAGYGDGAAHKPNPTTLSGVASQAVGLPAPPQLRSRRGLAIAIGVGVFAIGVTIGITFVGTGGKPRAASDVPAAPPPPSAPKPDETKPDETKPDEIKPGETKPGETKPGTKADDTKPDLGLVEEPKPGDARPDDPKPDATKPGVTNVKKPTKPAKPARPVKPTRPAKTAASMRGPSRPG